MTEERFYCERPRCSVHNKKTKALANSLKFFKNAEFVFGEDFTPEMLLDRLKDGVARLNNKYRGREIEVTTGQAVNIPSSIQPSSSIRKATIGAKKKSALRSGLPKLPTRSEPSLSQQPRSIMAASITPETLQVEPIKVAEPKCPFKPFQKVLVRDNCNDKWKADYFSHYDEDNRPYLYCCIGNVYGVCVSYEGNEHLLGTNKSPE